MNDMNFCTQWVFRTGYLETSQTFLKIFFSWDSEEIVQVTSKGELSLHWISENLSVLNERFCLEYDYKEISVKYLLESSLEVKDQMWKDS